MTQSRFIVSLTALSLAGASCGFLAAQDEQANNFDGGAGGTGDDFDNQDNWNEGGPDDWPVDPDSGAQDLDEGGISFDVEQVGTDPYLINVNDVVGYENMGDMHVLGEAAILLYGDPANTTYFQFGANDEIRTGEGALAIQNIDIQLAGNFTFHYGSGDEDEPGATISQLWDGAAWVDVMVGGQNYNDTFNLIIDGEINDGGNGYGNRTLTFAGDGFALLTGGIVGGGEGEDDDETPTEWKLSMSSAASLMLAGGTGYYLGNGVDLNYSGGSTADRGAGRGILQVTDGATLDTTDDGSGGSTDGNIDLNGWSALLIGSIDLADGDTMEELEELGFNINTDPAEGDVSTIGQTTGSGQVVTNDMTLDGDSVVVVGGDGEVDGENLAVNGSSTFMIQSGGDVEFEQLATANSGRLINYGTVNITDAEESVTNAGTMINGGNITIASGFANTGTLEMTGGSMTIAENAAFSGDTTISGGSITAQSSFGLDGTMTIDGAGATVNAGTYDAADLDSIELNGTLTITDGNFNANGDTSIGGEVYLDGGTFTVGSAGEDEMDFALTSAARFGGHGNLNINNSSGLLLNGGTLFVGINEDDGFAPGNLVVSGGSIDASGSDLEFAVSGDPLDNSSLDLTNGFTESNSITFDGDSTIGIGVYGEEYIENDTVFELIIADNGDIVDWENLSIEQLEATNSVTRFFDFVRDANGEIIDYGSVTITADYLLNAGQFQGLAGWLGNNANGGISELASQFDQIGSVADYQFALQQLQPTSFASGQQVVADTRQFSVLREAVEGLGLQQNQRRPGPAQRPLGQESHSMLASQDEADAIQSRYGYGAGPQSGARRVANNEVVAFVQAYGRSVDLQNKGGVLGISANDWGVVGGVATQLDDEWMLGILVGYDAFDGTLNDNGGSVDVDTLRVGPFVSWSDGTWIVDAAIAGAYNDWNGTQNTGLAAPNASYDWNTSGYQFDASAGLGYNIPLGGGVSLIPEGSLVYSYMHTDSYSGRTNVAQYDIAADNLNAVISRLGVAAQFNFLSGLILEGRIGWQGNYSFGGEIETAINNIPLVPATADTVDRNTVYYGVQATWMPDWNYGFSLRYEGQSGDGTDDQSIAGTISFEF